MKKKFDLTKRLTEGSVAPVIIYLAFPILLGLLLNVIYTITDTFFVSRINPSDPGIVGGVGLIFPVIVLGTGIASGINIGVNSLVARSLGSNSTAVLGKIGENGLLIASIAGLLVLILGLLFSKDILFFLGGVGSYYDNGYAYFEKILFVYPATFMINVFLGILQGEGRMKSVMTTMFIGTVANFILNPLFIFGLNRGVAGAAEATVIAQCLALAYVISLFIRQIPCVKIQWSLAALDKKVVQSILSVGISHALAQFAAAGSLLLMNRLIVSIDTNAMTAFSLGQRTSSLLFAPLLAISGALVTAVGQNYGRKDFARIHRFWRASVLISMIVFSVLATIIFIMAPHIFPLFTSVPEVITYAVKQVRTIEWTFIVACSGIMAHAVFQAMGNTLPAMILTALRILVIAIPAMLFYVFVLDWGVVGVWLGLMTGNICGGICGFIWVERTLRKLQKKSEC